MEGTGYEIRIQQKNGEDIFLSAEAVTNVKFKIDTVGEDVKDRSEDLVNRVEITGYISQDTKDETRKLTLWSMDKIEKKIYRKMKIILKKSGEVLRTYEMTKVFCVNYMENFDSQGNATYELVVAQCKGEMNEIKVGSV